MHVSNHCACAGIDPSERLADLTELTNLRVKSDSDRARIKDLADEVAGLRAGGHEQVQEAAAAACCR